MRALNKEFMKNTPINRETVSNAIVSSGITNLGYASIREIVKLVNVLRRETGVEFIRMEMGVPGLPSAEVGIRAEIEALKHGVASIYPDIEGLPEMKTEASKFVKNFLDVDVKPECCVPTGGAMMGGMASFMVANRNDRNKEGTLFIDPGFPVQKTQTRILGQEFRSFDVYNYRGEKLGPKLESILECGKVSTILYSNPNNPSWICLTDDELRTIGTLARKYDVIVIEDLAYFGMDFRENYSVPGEPPFQPTVAKYCDDYILLISSSKIFSYAGQRIGLLVMSDHLYSRHYPDLLRYYSTEIFGSEKVQGLTYLDCLQNEQKKLAVDGIFIQIGLLPNTEWLKGTLGLNAFGEIIVDKYGATNIPGVFAAGDCTDSPYKQIIISMGAGANAALSVSDYLIRN